MEADWAVEVGPDLPSIDVPWEGFVDLRQNPSAANALAETAQHPALRDALIALNSAQSPVFTSKCDLWSLTRAEIDPDEFNSAPENAREGIASYIDLLQLDSARLASFDFHEHWARSLTGHLKAVKQTNGRVDLVLRPATVDSVSGYGITLYAAGCGAGTRAANAAWEAVLRAAVAVTMNLGLSPALTGE